MGCFKTIKGTIVRLFFVFHISLCVWRLVEEMGGFWGWWLIGACAALLLFVEAAITLGCTKHGEWRRFVPCIFIYLLGTVPALCLTEWTLLQRRIDYLNATNQCPSTVDVASNSSSLSMLNLGVGTITYNWSLALQQLLVILLVAGRWILPKGKMSRETLSDILLAYIGMAADILEFYSEGIQTEQIRCNETVVLVILCLWAISLVQFSLNLGHSMKRRGRAKSLSQVNETVLQRCQSSTVWAIIVIVVMQDGPFLCMRLYLIIEHNILDQGLIFFTFKNVLIVMLQLYRLWILLCLTWDANEGKFSFRLVASIRHRNDDNNNRQSSVGLEQANAAFEDDSEEEERDHFYPQRESTHPQSPHPQSPHHLSIPEPTFPPQQQTPDLSQQHAYVQNEQSTADNSPAKGRLNDFGVDFSRSVRNPGHFLHPGKSQIPQGHPHANRPQSPHQGNPQGHPHANRPQSPHQGNPQQGYPISDIQHSKRPQSPHQGNPQQGYHSSDIQHPKRPQSPHEGNTRQGFQPYNHQGQREYNEQRSHPHNVQGHTGQNSHPYNAQDHTAYNRRYPNQPQQAPYTVSSHTGNQYYGRR